MRNETMRKACIAVAAVCLMAAPSYAGNWQDTVQSDFHSPTVAVRSGAFVGARFVTSFGRQNSSRGQISLAPTHSHISGNGSVKTWVGEGLAVNFSVKSKPSLTLVGARADVLLGTQSRRLGRWGQEARHVQRGMGRGRARHGRCGGLRRVCCLCQREGRRRGLTYSFRPTCSSMVMIRSIQRTISG